MEPCNPQVVYAALWQTRRPPWNVYPPSNGPGSGLYKSTDGGTTWTQLTQGSPHVRTHRTCIAAAAPHRIYAQRGCERQRWRRLSFRRRRCDTGRAPTATRASGSAAGISAASPPIRTMPTCLRDGYGDLSLDRRRTHVQRVYSAIRPATTFTRYGSIQTIPTHDFRKRSGRHRQRQRSAHLELVVQPADRAVLSRRSRSRVPFNAYGAQQDSGAAMQTSGSKYGAISQQDFRPLDAGGENGNLAPDPRHPSLVYGDSSGQGGRRLREKFR